MISQSRRLGVAVSEMTPHQSPIRIKAAADLWSAWPLMHTASQKRIGRTSACPIGRCTVLVAHRPVAGVQPLVARALVAES